MSWTQQSVPTLGERSRSQTPLQSVSTPTSGAPPPGFAPQKEDGKSDTELSDIDKYGLHGLLSLIRGENTDQNTVALGTDLSLLGLDMTNDSVDVKLSMTFPSPWVETSRSEVEPAFTTPETFKVIVPPLQDKFSLLSEQTLFYIFYTRPRDVLQELSARELVKRNWRYHKVLQVWLTKDTAVEPTPQGPNSERGVYIFFDPQNWDKVRKDFVLQYDLIMQP